MTARHKTYIVTRSEKGKKIVRMRKGMDGKRKKSRRLSEEREKRNMNGVLQR